MPGKGFRVLYLTASTDSEARSETDSAFSDLKESFVAQNPAVTCDYRRIQMCADSSEISHKEMTDPAVLESYIKLSEKTVEGHDAFVRLLQEDSAKLMAHNSKENQ